MTKAVAALVIDVEGMVRMLHSRYAKSETRKRPYQALDQRGLAGILEPGDTDDFVIHAAPPASRRSAAARSAGVLTLKKGSCWTIDHSATPWR